ncbi:MAG TPA: hypothetical protein VGE45_00275 [Chloroflexia bacterium]|jgi:hypothetical protein
MYAINGNPLDNSGASVVDLTWPTSHEVDLTPTIEKAVLGGVIVIEPPGGRLRIVTWHFGQRRAEAINAIKSYIGSNPICYIDTYAGKNPDGTDIVWRDLKVAVTFPPLKTADNRGFYEPFSIVWREIEVQL